MICTTIPSGGFSEEDTFVDRFGNTVTTIYRAPDKKETPFQEARRRNGDRNMGMPMGNTHDWNYVGRWREMKVKPDLWTVLFSATKSRRKRIRNYSKAPKPGTEYNWFFMGQQVARKIDANSYETFLTALKFKVGHKRPHWRAFTYDYPGQQPETEMLNKYIREGAARFIGKGQVIIT